MNKPTVTPLARPSLHKHLVSNLRGMILDGELAPGTKVPEKALCHRFDVSRTPLREALKVLASEGLLELQPNRGATVSALTEDDIAEIFPVIGALEALAGELAAEQISEDNLAEIRAIHYQMLLHHRRGEQQDYFRLNEQIHAIIIEAANNATLSDLHASLAGRVRRTRYLNEMSESRWETSVAEHEEMLIALTERDGKRLCQVLKKHLANKCATLQQELSAAD